jgi:hypothetical protein
MGTGWRRAFCTTIPRDPDSSPISDKQQRSPSSSPSPRSCTRLGFLSGGSSNPSTPRLRCRTTSLESTQTPTVDESPRLQCKTSTPKTSKSPRSLIASNQTSPRSPLKLSLFKNSFKFRVSTFRINTKSKSSRIENLIVLFYFYIFYRVAVEYV